MSPSLSSARERASTPRAQSVPLGVVLSANRRSASAARSCVSAAHCRLDEFDRRPARYHHFHRVGGGALGCLHRLLVATEAVVQHGVRPLGER